MTGWVLEKGSDALGQADNIDRKFGNYFSAFVSVNPAGAGRKGKGGLFVVGAGANLPGSFSLKSVKSVTQTRGLGANCHNESVYLVLQSEHVWQRVLSLGITIWMLHTTLAHTDTRYRVQITARNHRRPSRTQQTPAPHYRLVTTCPPGGSPGHRHIIGACLHLLILNILHHCVSPLLLPSPGFSHNIWNYARREVRDIMTAEHCLGRVETGRTGIIMTQEQRGRRVGNC